MPERDEGRGVMVSVGRRCVPAGAALLLLSLYVLAQGDEAGMAFFLVGGAVLGIGCFLHAARLLE